ncbi:hypothetical protein Fmac_016957 [Flemingia macrophylla]|uniref:Alkane hydroxylase MAH1-like n=1 Tax=Flemingia macrophylla TaxID=520843 RepID=A0ABD1MIW8_9FABA
MDYLVTCDSLNVQHMLLKNFENYVKGPVFRQIFEPFGDGVVVADAETWKYYRTHIQFFIKQRRHEAFIEQIVQNKVKTCLLPILDHVQEHGKVVDLQDLFSRFAFDNICSIVAGRDPMCLSMDFPEVVIERAFNESEESIFYRHTVPMTVWKVQKWLQIGQEKTMTKACKTLDEFIYSCIASKREELRKCSKEEMDELPFDLITALITSENCGSMADKGKGRVHSDKFLRDGAFNYFVAGRETMTSALTWFFWLLSIHPLVEAKIVEEIKVNFPNNDGILGTEEVKKLVYLHGALYESLRLFPPVPIERKQAIKADTLPSGHHVHPNTMILFSLYAMGRSEEIWGKDCLEFKPERWISNKGDVIYVPSYKFITFNAGPRTCLGKDSAMVQMKILASAILHNYRFQVVEVTPITTRSKRIAVSHGGDMRLVAVGDG